MYSYNNIHCNIPAIYIRTYVRKPSIYYNLTIYNIILNLFNHIRPISLLFHTIYTVYIYWAACIIYIIYMQPRLHDNNKNVMTF